MKIAILYSGYPNNFNACIENHEKNIFSKFKNQKIEVNIFGHFWYTEESKKELEEEYRTIKEKNLFKKFVIQKQLDENKINYKNYKADNLFPIHLNNTMSQAYSWKKSWEVMSNFEKNNSEKYDLVMRIRPDEYFFTELKNIENISMDSLYFKNEFVHLNFGLNDHFAYGSRDLMFHYLNLYDKIYKIIDQGCPINLELMLGYYLRIIKNIKIDKIDIDFELYRRINN